MLKGFLDHILSRRIKFSFNPIVPVAAAIAWFSNPAFIGWAGVGESILVGAGAMIAWKIAAEPVGFVSGLILAFIAKGKKWGQYTALTLGIAGGAVGSVVGYQFSCDALTAGDKVTTVFNDESQKPDGLKLTTPSTTSNKDTTFAVRPDQDSNKVFVAPVR